MTFADRITRTTYSRFLWGGLTLLFLVGLFVARSSQRTALNTEVRDAQTRANGYANATVAQAATVDAGTITFVPKDLAVVEESDIFTDPSVARVRVWAADGLLLASSDPSEDVGDLRASGSPAMTSALQGTTTAQIAQEPFTFSTIGGPERATDLLQVFAPLRVKEQVEPAGAVQVDFLYDTLRDASSSPWVMWSRLFLILAIVSALMFVLTMLRTPIPATERAARARAVAREDEDATLVDAPSATDRAGAADVRSSELEEELEAAREQLQQATEAYAFLEARMKSDQGRPAASPDVEAPAERIAELETSLKRAEAEAALARTSAVSQEELDEVRSAADERIAQMEQQLQEESAKAASAASVDPELEALRAQVAEAESRALDTEEALAAAQQDVMAARNEADTARRKATDVAAAAPKASPPAAAAKPAPANADPEDLIAELEARVAEAEARAKEAEDEARQLTPEANDLRARLARTAARKKMGPSSE